MRDLQPYLGAAAHVAIVSQDTRAFAYTHGEVPGQGGAPDAGMGGMSGMAMEAPPARFGPLVSFTHRFPRPGLYKIWGQFAYHARVLTVSFGVRVGAKT
ncbi:MAG: hypothetical protein NVSMB65_15050 [Chloroflexota bacterium]